MTSREIIIDLIDKKIINGEQAFTLINDLLKAEMLEAWETLNASKQNSKSNFTDDFNKIWVTTNPPYSSGTTYTTTALSATSGTNVSSI